MSEQHRTENADQNGKRAQDDADGERASGLGFFVKEYAQKLDQTDDACYPGEDDAGKCEIQDNSVEQQDLIRGCRMAGDVKILGEKRRAGDAEKDGTDQSMPGKHEQLLG
ncbi:MAG: hypothetical protein K6E50_14490 [Lachnospiraceae bacterium]|nr:hypothetical protein [Lachnospiraceae bacterium]